MLGTLWLAGAAFAQQGPPYSIDIELVRPAFGQQGFAGLDVPVRGRSLTARYGALLMYENAPLTLVQATDSAELGSVVTNRMQLWLGASMDVDRVTFSVMVPSALSWGSQFDEYSRDGAGLGDVAAAARLVVLEQGPLHTGVRAGITLPTGRSQAWLGEEGPRLGAGLLASLDLGPLTVASDLGLTSRTAVRTSEDFIATHEITWGTGGRLRLPDATRLAGTFQLLTRAGVSEFLAGGAENPAEILGGVEVYPSRQTTLTFGLGRGLNEGYGTTDLRVVSGLVVQPQLKREVPPPLPDWRPPKPPPPPEVPKALEDGPDQQKLQDEGAVVHGTEILIRDMVEFVVDTDKIQPYSLDELQAVADLLNADARIAHIVVEGHASEEGDYAHNYDLAESRAQAIWEFLLEHGVAEERVSYRGFGEVKRLVAGSDEAALQKNRRVRFVIVRQLPDQGPFPTYPETQVLPWNATQVPVVQPPPYEVPEPPGEFDEIERGVEEE